MFSFIPVAVIFADLIAYTYRASQLLGERVVPGSLAIYGGVAYAVVVGLLSGATHVWKRWARTVPLSRAELRRVYRAPLADCEFWRKPRYAALLATELPAVTAQRAAEPRAPNDFVLAITQLAAQLDGAMRDVCAQSEEAARHLSERDTQAPRKQFTNEGLGPHRERTDQCANRTNEQATGLGSRRVRKNQRQNAVGMSPNQVLRDHAAKRPSNDMRSLDPLVV